MNGCVLIQNLLYKRRWFRGNHNESQGNHYTEISLYGIVVRVRRRRVRTRDQSCSGSVALSSWSKPALPLWGMLATSGNVLAGGRWHAPESRADQECCKTFYSAWTVIAHGSVNSLQVEEVCCTITMRQPKECQVWDKVHLNPDLTPSTPSLCELKHNICLPGDLISTFEKNEEKTLLQIFTWIMYIKMLHAQYLQSNTFPLYLF